MITTKLAILTPLHIVNLFLFELGCAIAVWNFVRSLNDDNFALFNLLYTNTVNYHSTRLVEPVYTVTDKFLNGRQKRARTRFSFTRDP